MSSINSCCLPTVCGHVSGNGRHGGGVATGWTGWLNMSTPLLTEVVPEIDANPVSIYSGGGIGGWGVGHGLELDSPFGRRFCALSSSSK